MSEHKRSTSGESQPITRHPLFPVIIALWFGAIFGLGSIAIRPALIESAVTALGIDKVIPMATPPLGTTTRILIALAMTGLGGLIGVVLGRRIARPLPETVERRRGATPFANEERAAPAPEQKSGRRRALSGKGSESAEKHPEHASVPGSDSQILNLSEFDLDSFEDNSEPEDAVPFRAPPGLKDIESGESTIVAETASSAEPDDAEPTAFDRHLSVGSFARPSATASPIFQPDPQDSDWYDDALPAQSSPENQLNNSLFETYSREIAARAERRSLEAPASPANGAVTASPPEPGFNLLPRLNENSDPHDEDTAETPLPKACLPCESEETAEAAADKYRDKAKVEIAGEKSGTAAERIASAELDTLSPVELLERLALAMAQCRERNRQAAVAPVLEPDLAEVEPQTEPADTKAEAEALAVAPPLSVPLSDEARESPAKQDDPPPEERQPVAALPPIPAALRPVGFDAFDSEEEDDDSLPGYIPPRHIGLVKTTAEQEAAGLQDPPLAEEDGEDDIEEADVLEQGYSSLLDLSRPLAGPDKAQPFIRIEEPADEDAIEPVVMFPGEETRTPRPSPITPEQAAASPQAPAPQDMLPASGKRLFDAPENTNPEETEKALRAALATLQRMSGAA